MSESERVHLALPRSGIASVERIAGAVIDVLVVQEDDDPLRYRAAQVLRPKGAKNSPAGAGRPGRRGRLVEVYPTGAVAQACRARTTLTMHTGTVSWSWQTRETEESTVGIRRVWSPLRGSSRVTMAAHGGRCAGTITSAAPVARNDGAHRAGS